MTSSPVGIAIVGTGFGQKVHIPALQDIPTAKIMAVYHRDRPRAEAIAQRHGIPIACDRLDPILDHPEIQGVAISTPPFLHYEMARRVLNAKKHLFLEKPMTMDLSEAKTLYALAQHHQRAVALNFEFRFVPAWMHLHQLLSQGYVGTPRLISIQWIVPGRADPQRPWSWHAAKALGGGSLGALGSHSFDYIHWLFGPIQRLTAHLATHILTRPNPSSGEPKLVDADDSCALTLELASGALVQLSISATAYAGRGHWIEVYGDRGTLVLGSNHPTDYVHGFTLQGSQGGSPLAPLAIPAHLEFPKTYTDGRIAPVTRVFQTWLDAMAIGAAAPAKLGRSETSATSMPLTPDIREGVATQLLMDLARDSHQRRTWVEVPDLGSILE
jgi:predicted dehydrogenase